jgi:hypothetical protein
MLNLQETFFFWNENLSIISQTCAEVAKVPRYPFWEREKILCLGKLCVVKLDFTPRDSRDIFISFNLLLVEGLKLLKFKEWINPCVIHTR